MAIVKNIIHIIIIIRIMIDSITTRVCVSCNGINSSSYSALKHRRRSARAVCTVLCECGVVVGKLRAVTACRSDCVK